jgi:hypothetical protein
MFRKIKIFILVSSALAFIINSSPWGAFNHQTVIHEVIKHDTISLIANSYQVDVSKIISRNNIRGDKIYVGQKLFIKQTASIPSYSAQNILLAIVSVICIALYISVRRQGTKFKVTKQLLAESEGELRRQVSKSGIKTKEYNQRIKNISDSTVPVSEWNVLCKQYNQLLDKSNLATKRETGDLTVSEWNDYLNELKRSA